jgi:hypothetical protein
MTACPAVEQIRFAGPGEHVRGSVQELLGGVQRQRGVFVEAGPYVPRVQGQFTEPQPRRCRNVDGRGQEAHVDAKRFPGARVQRLVQSGLGLARLEEPVGALPARHGVPPVPYGLVEVAAGIRLAVEGGLEGGLGDLGAAAQMAEHLRDVPIGRTAGPGRRR